jgi:hypothetical protein
MHNRTLFVLCLNTNMQLIFITGLFTHTLFLIIVYKRRETFKLLQLLVFCGFKVLEPSRLRKVVFVVVIRHINTINQQNKDKFSRNN